MTQGLSCKEAAKKTVGQKGIQCKHRRAPVRVFCGPRRKKVLKEGAKWFAEPLLQTLRLGHWISFQLSWWQHVKKRRLVHSLLLQKAEPPEVSARRAGKSIR